MNMQPDNELLRQYAQTHSEEAFAELVKRHVNLVYSAALRQVGGDAHLAHDVAQNVFTDLARKATSLSRRDSLTGWLYTSAYFAASKMARTEHRRREREEQFMREPIADPTSEADWEKLRPILDAAMHDLKEPDREAVLLRYFENCPYAEVGAKLGLNENAARMRVERALEKLRALLAKRAITATAGLASILSANAVQVAPAGMATVLTTASLAAAGTGAMTLAKVVAVTKFKLALGTLVVGGVITALIIQHRTFETLRQENESLQRQIVQLQANRGSNYDAATNDSAQLSLEEMKELLKLRTEVTQSQAMQRASIAAATPLTNDLSDTTNININLRVTFAFLHTSDLQSLRPALTPAASGICVLSGEQSKFVDDAMQTMNYERDTAQITTRNGRQVRASVGLNSFPIGGTNATVQATLAMTPNYSPVSSLFNLSPMSLLYRLTGDSSQPDPQTIQTLTNQVALLAGQTVAWQQDVLPGVWQPDRPETLLVFITPEIGKPDQNVPSVPASSPEESRAHAMFELNIAKQSVLGMILYANEHGGQVPTNFEQAAAFYQSSDARTNLNHFEILFQGSIGSIADPASTIIVREIQPWSVNGKWFKTYGFADGHSEVHSEPNGNFDEWEQRHAAVLKNP